MQIQRAHYSPPSISSSTGSASMRLRSASFARQIRLRTMFNDTYVTAATSGNKKPSTTRITNISAYSSNSSVISSRTSSRHHSNASASYYDAEPDCTTSTSVSSSRLSNHAFTRRFVDTTMHATMHDA